MMGVFHRHAIVIFFNIVGWLIFGTILPAWLYHFLFVQSTFLWFTLPMWTLVVYLFGIWALLVVKLFDWYNDVWIVTRRGLVDIDWRPLKKNAVFTEYKDITGIEANEATWYDSFLKLGDLVIHKIGADLRVRRLARASEAVALIQQMQDAQANPEKEAVSDPGMHIYFDGVKQQVRVGKHGELYTDTPLNEQERKYVDGVKGEAGTIDLTRSEESGIRSEE